MWLLLWEMAFHMAREPKRTPLSTLVPYPQVCHTCGTHGFTPELWWDQEGWHLDIRDKAELIVRVLSMEAAPHAFRHLALQASKALEKSGLLDT